jgi:hypothetical protein
MVRKWNDKALNVFLTRTIGGRLNSKLDLLAARTLPKALRAEIRCYETFKIMFEDKGPVGLVLRSLRSQAARNTIRSRGR